MKIISCKECIWRRLWLRLTVWVCTAIKWISDCLQCMRIEYVHCILTEVYIVCASLSVTWAQSLIVSESECEESLIVSSFILLITHCIWIWILYIVDECRMTHSWSHLESHHMNQNNVVCLLNNIIIFLIAAVLSMLLEWRKEKKKEEENSEWMKQIYIT